MKFKRGILYGLSNPLWNNNNIHKLGNTGQTMKKRLSTMHTSLYINCEIVYKTNELVCCKFYEYLLKKILISYRINKKREFYLITEEEIKLIYDFFIELNIYLNCDEKLLKYIKDHFPEYLNKKRYCKKESYSSKNKSKKRKGIWIDTSY